MFKEILFDEVTRVFNEETTSGLLFEGNKDLVVYDDDPYLIDKTSLSAFDWNRKEVIPISEEYNQETAFFDIADRSDYIIQYQVYFKLDNLDAIKTALKEFRAYFYANKYQEIDGYNVTFKVTRGEKQGTWAVSAGNYWGRYKVSVYITASTGYLIKDTDIWQIKEYGTVDEYVQVETIDDICATNYNVLASSKSEVMSNYLTVGSFTGKFRIPYTGDALSEVIYKQIMNKSTRMNTLYNLKETLNGVVKEYEVIIPSGARTKKLNEPLFLEFDVVEL